MVSWLDGIERSKEGFLRFGTIKAKRNEGERLKSDRKDE